MRTTEESFRHEIEGLWSAGITGEGVTVGLLDTALDHSHPALRGRISRRCCFARDGFGQHHPTSLRSETHATHIASALLGSAHRRRDRGIAPGALLVHGEAIEDGAVIARVAAGLDWLAESDVQVVCLPLGLPTGNPVLGPFIDRLVDADVVVVAPIGNGGPGAHSVPAVHDGVLAVGAASPDGRVADLSGSCNEPDTRVIAPLVLGPGIDQRCAVPGGGWTLASGTSVAAARITGLAALLRSARPDMSASALIEAILCSAAPPARDQRHRTCAGLPSPKLALGAMGIGEEHRDRPRRDLRRPATPERYTDSRLVATLDRSAHDTLCDALLVHDGSLSARHVERASRLIRFRHTPAVLVRSTTQHLQALMSDSRVVMASATDVDRSMSLR